MGLNEIVVGGLNELSEVEGKVDAVEWWRRYDLLYREVGILVEETTDAREKRSALELKMRVVELGAKVGGLLKSGEVPVTIENLLIVYRQKALDSLGVLDVIEQ